MLCKKGNFTMSIFSGNHYFAVIFKNGKWIILDSKIEKPKKITQNDLSQIILDSLNKGLECGCQIVSSVS